MVKDILYRKIDNLYLPIILLTSIALRLFSASYFGNEISLLPGVYDQISYHNLAIRVLDGFGFTFGEPWWPVTAANEPTAHWSYLYTSYLIGVYGIFGRYPIIARLLQVFFVGALHPYFTYKIGEKVFSKSVGLIAAAWSAFYIYFVYYSAALMTEPVYITAILASIYFALLLSDSEQKSPWKYAVYLGVSLAVTVLLRQLFALFIPFMFLWVWWRAGLNRFNQLFLSGIILLSAILPLTAYNYSRFDQFVLLNTNAGFAFYWGNHPIHETRFISILSSETYVELIPEELHSLSEADLEDALMDKAMGFIKDDPVRYIQLSLSRIPSYFMFWPSTRSTTLSNISRVMSFGISLPFIIYGLWISLKRWRFKLAEPETLLYLFMGFYISIHLLSWALIRYRLPVDAIFLLFSGLAAVQLLEPFAEKYRFRTKFALNASNQGE